MIAAFFIAVVSALYAMAGQAGGTGFLAVMAFTAFPPDDMRATALTLNVVAACYSTWRLHRAGAVAWRWLAALVAASVPAAFLGGSVQLTGPIYFAMTGCLLLAVALLMLLRRAPGKSDGRKLHLGAALLLGSAIGFVSGLTGIGGGVFLAPLLLSLDWVSPKRVAGVSAPFILANSAAGLSAMLITGHRVPASAGGLALAALAGSVLGTHIGLHRLSPRAIRYLLAATVFVASAQLFIHAVR